MGGERVWDRYLTERDRIHVAMTRPRREVGFGSSPALLLIDNYRAVFGAHRQPLLEAAVANRNAIGDEAWDAAERIADVLAAARAAGIPVIHITGLSGAGLPNWHESVHAGDRRGDLTLEKPGAAARFEIVESCAPVEGEVVLQKTAPSAFWGTPLAGALNYLGVDTLIVAGESTSGCVRASVVEAAAYRYRVVVVEECVYDRHQASHAINLFDMHQKYADVLPLADVLRWIGGFPHATP